jgi:hypothetical protein
VLEFLLASIGPQQQYKHVRCRLLRGYAASMQSSPTHFHLHDIASTAIVLVLRKMGRSP